jgi:hypothetical protein
VGELVLFPGYTGFKAERDEDGTYVLYRKKGSTPWERVYESPYRSVFYGMIAKGLLKDLR